MKRPVTQVIRLVRPALLFTALMPAALPAVQARGPAVPPATRTEPAVASTLFSNWNHPDPTVRRVAITRTLERVYDPSLIPPLTDLLQDPDPEVRRLAFWGLNRYEDPAVLKSHARLVPLLLTCLDRPDDRNGAMMVLEKIQDSSAIPVLLKKFNPSGPERYVWLNAIRAYGGEARAVLPVLLTLDAHPDAEFRVTVLKALVPIGGPEMVPHLRQALKRPQEEDRRAALEELASLGPAALPALPDVQKILSSSSAALRLQTVRTLGEMQDEGALPGLEKGWRDPDEQVRVAALEGLAKLAHPRSLAILTMAMHGPSPILRSHAMTALRRYPDREGILAAHRAGLQSRNSALRNMVLAALYYLPDPGAGELLLWAATHLKGDERLAALGGIRALRHPQSISHLAGAMDHEDAALADAARDALCAIEHPEVLPALMGLLDRPAHAGAAAALRALTKFGRDALPALRRAIQHPDPNIHLNAFTALGALGQEGLPDLLIVLTHPDLSRRRHVLGLLPRTQSAREILPVLLTHLASPSADLRSQALEGLGQLGLEGAAAGPQALILLETETDLHVRNMALFALSRMQYRPALPAIRALLTHRQLGGQAKEALVYMSDLESPILKPKR